jgi:hypothetical protein
VLTPRATFCLGDTEIETRAHGLLDGDAENERLRADTGDGPRKGRTVEIPIPTQVLLIAVSATCGSESSAHVEPRRHAMSL